MLSLLFFRFQRFLKSTFLVKCIHIIVLFHDCCCCYFSSCYIFLFVKLVVFSQNTFPSVCCVFKRFVEFQPHYRERTRKRDWEFWWRCGSDDNPDCCKSLRNVTGMSCSATAGFNIWSPCGIGTLK